MEWFLLILLFWMFFNSVWYCDHRCWSLSSLFSWLRSLSCMRECSLASIVLVGLCGDESAVNSSFQYFLRVGKCCRGYENGTAVSMSRSSSFSSSMWAPISIKSFPSAQMHGDWDESRKGTGSPTWQIAVQLFTSYKVILPLFVTAAIWKKSKWIN